MVTGWCFVSFTDPSFVTFDKLGAVTIAVDGHKANNIVVSVHWRQSIYTKFVSMQKLHMRAFGNSKTNLHYFKSLPVFYIIVTVRSFVQSLSF